MSEVVKARVSLNLPASLKAAAEKFAERDGVSLNQFISVALAEKVGAQGAVAFFENRAQGGSAASAVEFLAGSPDVDPDVPDAVEGKTGG